MTAGVKNHLKARLGLRDVILKLLVYMAASKGLHFLSGYCPELSDPITWTPPHDMAVGFVLGYKREEC